MKNFFIFLISSFFLLNSIQAATTHSVSEINPFPSKSGWDLDLDLGSTLKKNDPQIFSRLRIGKFWMQEPKVMALGLDVGKFSNFGFGGGAEGEWIHLPSGLWIQGKVLTTQNEILVTGLSVGWSLVGVEGLVSPLNSSRATLYAKIRLPLGLIAAQ
jgi:hypothetical protein